MKDTSYPAYPCEGIYLEIDKKDLQEKYSGVRFENSGMTLRDYFAGQALSGMATLFLEAGGSSEDIATANAKMCYLMADAMLAERTIDNEIR